jgi:hypothetical protein
MLAARNGTTPYGGLPLYVNVKLTGEAVCDGFGVEIEVVPADVLPEPSKSQTYSVNGFPFASM